MAKFKKHEARLEDRSLITEIIKKSDIVPDHNLPECKEADLNVTGPNGAAFKTAVSYADSPMLFTLAPLHGLSFAVLRRNFSGKTNQVPDWILGKLGLNPAGAPLSQGSRLANVRRDILLPDGASDELYHPSALCALYERTANEHQKDLVIHCKLLVDGYQPLHHWWEAARMFATDTLVKAHQLSVIMVLHDPPATGYISAVAPHIHLMAPARRLSARGFRETSVLARDDAHQMLANTWQEVRRQRNL